MIRTGTVYPGRHRANMDAVTVDHEPHVPRHRVELFIVEWKTHKGRKQQVTTEGKCNASRIAREIAFDGGTEDICYYRAPEVVR